MKSYKTSAYRCASDLFATTVFRKVVRENDTELFNVRALRLLEACPDLNAYCTGDIICKAYSILSDCYRVEYFYKNTILNELLTKKQFTQDSVVVFNEFKINKSIADVVYINGKNRAYEIKTELDSPERLHNQIADYKKMFSEINIVTHISLYEKYKQLLNDHTIGIYVLDEGLKIQIKRQATADNTKLDLEVMLKTLRKKEIISLVYDLTNVNIQTSNILFFDECLSILEVCEIFEVQLRVFYYLKKRGINEKDMLLDVKTMKELKYLCLSMGFVKRDYETLYSFLNLPILK